MRLNEFQVVTEPYSALETVLPGRSRVVIPREYHAANPFPPVTAR